MNENQNVFDTQYFKAEKEKYRRLAARFGLAMIILVLNNRFSPYLFVFIAALFSAGEPLSYSGIIILNEFSAYLFPIVIFHYMFREECRAFVPYESYKPFIGEAFLMFTTGMTIGAMGTIITHSVNTVIDYFFGTGEIEEAFAGMEPQNMGEFGIFAFCICIVAPIAEEYLFRSLLLKPLRAYGDLTAAVVSGLVFGLYHGNFDQFAYAALLGIFFSIIAIRYNSIVPTIILHAANNIIVTCGNNLESACENTPAAIKDFCVAFSEICSIISAILIPLGFVFLFVCIAKKSFTLHGNNRFLPQNEALLEFVKVPMVIIGTVIMFIPFFF